MLVTLNTGGFDAKIARLSEYPYRIGLAPSTIFDRTAVSDIAWSRGNRWRVMLAGLWPEIAGANLLDTTYYYGERFGNGLLLARRLVEAGVGLVQVNWTRIAGQPNQGGWDTHAKHNAACKSLLMPIADRCFSALIEALETRTGNRLVRSDWVKAGDTEPEDEARQQLSALPAGFTTPGQLYIDYEL